MDTDDDCITIRDFYGMAVIFFGFFITGIGTSFFYSFGIPYIGTGLIVQTFKLSMFPVQMTMSRKTPRQQFSGWFSALAR